MLRLLAFGIVNIEQCFLCGDISLEGVVVVSCVARPLSFFASFHPGEEALYFRFVGVFRVRVILIV